MGGNLKMPIAVPLVMIRISATFLVLMFSLVSCNDDNQPRRIDNRQQTNTEMVDTLTMHAELQHDSTINDQSPIFGSRDTIRALIHSEHATDTSVITGRWFYLTHQQRLTSNQAQLNRGTNDTHFDLINATPWPNGDYELIVGIDGRLLDTLPFKIVSNR